MTPTPSDREPPAGDPLLAEQRAYYRRIAPEYEDYSIPGAWGGELEVALEAFCPEGDVLEIACGPGLWTTRLARHARTLTALDASPEMLARAASRVRDPRVRFVEADVFAWEPERAYDVVFFGFWLSHVPLERFDAFWSLVDRCLRPRGRVMFVDDSHRTADELVYGESAQIVRRRLNDGATYDVVKVPHRADELERRLVALGWAIRVTQSSGPFFWGAGSRARDA